MIDDGTLKHWFFREIFPLEPMLTRYIRRNWRDEDEVSDLRQEIYAKVYSSARGALPLNPKAFLFTVARNHLINQSRKGHVVSLDLVADLGASPVMVEDVTPERVATGREELRRVQAGLEQLPPRCREIVVLRRIEGLSAAEVADRMGIARNTVDQQVVHGMRALVDFMLGGTGKVRRPASRRAASGESE